MKIFNIRKCSACSYDPAHNITTCPLCGGSIVNKFNTMPIIALIIIIIIFIAGTSIF